MNCTHETMKYDSFPENLQTETEENCCGELYNELSMFTANIAYELVNNVKMANCS